MTRRRDVNRGRRAPRLVAAFGVALATLVGPTGCDPFHVEFDDVEPAQMYTSGKLKATGTARGTLRVMTYNVKFGGGRIDFFFDCHGDRVLMTESEVLQNLERLATVINEVDPDVLFVEEIDVNSKRTAYVDQVQWLLDHTHFNFGAYASQWRADYVPSDGIGPVDSGTAILSRWPLGNATRYALPLRQDQSGIVQYFYLRRNILEATTTRSSDDGRKLDTVHLVATHAEAYSQDGTKREHLRIFRSHVEGAAKRGPMVAGGDLNALPPNTEKLRNFPDSACTEEFLADDFSEETTWLEPLYDDYHSAIALDAYERDNARFFTHSTSEDAFWNRTLDHLFSNRPLSNGRVLQDEVGGVNLMSASDHAPLVVDVNLDRQSAQTAPDAGADEEAPFP